jgi:hypothetical protein
MRKWFPADSIFRRHVGLLVIVGTITIAGSLVMLQSQWLNNNDPGTDLTINELASPDEHYPLSDEPEISNPEIWKIPEVKPRDRTNRPLLELVGVFTGNDQDGTALIREKEGPTFTYRVGDKITGNRELVEIDDTYVLLQNAEHVERLRLRNRPLTPRYRSEDLKSLAEHLVGQSQSSSDQPSENR